MCWTEPGRPPGRIHIHLALAGLLCRLSRPKKGMERIHRAAEFVRSLSNVSASLLRSLIDRPD